jgi:hypothetical protein
MIKGLGSGVANLRVANSRISADISNAIHGDVTIRRTIEGASELSLTVSDPHGRIMKSSLVNEASRLSIDDLRFALVKVAKSGQDLSLSAEDHLVYRLRQKKGPKKAYRDKVTRAQFAKSLVREVGADIGFYSPELNKVQPIADGKEPGRTVTSRKVDEDREEGIPRNAKGLTVQGAPASRTQIKVGDELIREAMKYKPPHRALVSLVSAAIVESVMGTRGMVTPVDHDSIGILQGRLMFNSRNDLLSIPYNVRRFFVKPWTGGSKGAIALAKEGKSVIEICETVQGNDRTYSYRYGKWAGEANNWVKAYQGGSVDSTERTVSVTKRYAFEVKKKEDYWTALKRLAEEVNWRCFVVGNRVFFIAEPTLLRSRRRMLLGENPPGVDTIDWEVDSGKRSHTATVTGRITNWAAPPGTVVTLSEAHGPAAGRWIVSSIEGTLNNTEVSISLKRPSKPLPEPASETTTKTVGGRRPRQAGAGRGGADKMVKWLRAVMGTNTGSARHLKWCRALGASSSDPWCSIFVAYGLKEVIGIRSIPSNFPYSGSWIDWSGGQRVSRSQIKPGDLVIYGPRSFTGHVNVYIGNGKCIGGNQSGSVTEWTLSYGNSAYPEGIVAVIRPNYP